MLIVIEGLDGAGKSTQVALVKEYMEKSGRKLKYLHFPRFDAPVYGELIAGFLRGEFGPNDAVHPQLVALLFAQDRADAASIIREWLSQGCCVLLDRYVYSNIAYQCSKLKDKESADRLRKWIFDLEYEKFAIPVPDANIFLDVPISFVDRKLKEARKGDERDYLKGKADIHEADMEFQKRVRETYLEQCRADRNFIRVECAGENGEMLPAAQIFSSIKSIIDKLL
ncbi:MAG: dTMP kinase [Bacteroidetes bacterium]|uniref:Thymidylate kinase n=1 Tax=Candidatus Egerieousia excrementavium TaxID=2840778 RepID=A0A9D9GW71_9BACT|nr:dTMP kinase [Candidatus Egerieousia excrementavium]